MKSVLSPIKPTRILKSSNLRAQKRPSRNSIFSNVNCIIQSEEIVYIKKKSGSFSVKQYFHSKDISYTPQLEQLDDYIQNQNMTSAPSVSLTLLKQVRREIPLMAKIRNRVAKNRKTKTLISMPLNHFYDLQSTKIKKRQNGHLFDMQDHPYILPEMQGKIILGR